jgi:hypothetical protein
MPFRTCRSSRRAPPCRTGGSKGLTTAHSSSVRSNRIANAPLLLGQQRINDTATLQVLI